MKLDLSSGQRVNVTVLKPAETRAETMLATVISVSRHVVEVAPEGWLAIGAAVKLEWNAFIALAEVTTRPSAAETGNTFLRIQHLLSRDAVESLTRRWT